MSEAGGLEYRILRASVGPVQGFIGAARRTRDLWAGSFLLSRLAGEAMAVVERRRETHGCSVTIPALREDAGAGDVAEPTMKAILRAWNEDHRPPEEGVGFFRIAEGERLQGPNVGTLVNLFRARVDRDFDPLECKLAMNRRFQAIATHVRELFIDKAIERAREHPDEALRLSDEKAEEIRSRWAAQTDGSYFEFLWVLGDADVDWAEESCWLGHRKGLRDHVFLPETEFGLHDLGDRCPIHPEMSELGGFARARGHGQRQDAFWDMLRATVAEGVYGPKERREDSSDTEEELKRRAFETLEIRESERLSGFALVKRLFPLLPEKKVTEAIGWMPSIAYDIEEPSVQLTVRDAELSLRNWASTAFVSAIPWIVAVGAMLPEDAERYANDQYRVLDFDRRLRAERPARHRVKSVDALRVTTRDGNVPIFAVLDGTLHHERGLEKHRLIPRDELARLSSHEAQERKREAEAIANDLNQNWTILTNATDSSFGSIKEEYFGTRPSRFYGFLEMDGDRMGPVFSHSEAMAIGASERLQRFAASVPRIVREHDGVLVYAGADDVMALLPLDTALQCAGSIQESWGSIMNAKSSPFSNSISGSIVFADYQVALNEVRELTHRRLDAVAKDAGGRNALAVAVRKSGGVTASWVAKWDSPSSSETHSSDPKALAAFRKFVRRQRGEQGLGTALPYNLRERYSPLLAGPTEEELLTRWEIRRVLNRETGRNAANSRARDDEALGDCLAVMTRTIDVEHDEPGSLPASASWDMSALLLARFMTSEVNGPYSTGRTDFEDAPSEAD